MNMMLYRQHLRSKARMIVGFLGVIILLTMLFVTVPIGLAAQIVQNSQFDSGSTSWAIDNNGGGASVFTVDGSSQLSGTNSAKVVISAGSTNLYNVQLKQLLPVTAGKTYQITFMARSSVNRSIQLVIQKSTTPWTNYYTQNINITTGSATYGPYTFNATVTDAGAGIYFNLGGSANTVYLDNVVMNDGTVAATSTATRTLTRTPTATPAPASSIIRIEAGGAANFTDGSGNIWLADTSFTAGAGGVVDRGTALAIANTTNDRIYQTERWGMTAFAYAIPNGTYNVHMHLAETYWTSAGKRVFSANVEGSAISNIDIFAQVGANAALVKSTCVSVSDGQLNIAFSASVDQPEINGIEIIPAASCASVPPSIPGWNFIWSDEFNGTAINTSNWSYEIGYKRNNEQQYYTDRPENARLENGNLVIEARRENYGGYAYTSASLGTWGKRQFQYGRFEIRAIIPTPQGSWPAWWTLGAANPWPQNGEIDIMEFYQGKILANTVYQNASGGQVWDSVTKNISDYGAGWSNNYHIWVMEWDANTINLYVDGLLLNTSNVNDATVGSYNPFRHPHYMLLNLAIGGNSGGDPSGTAFPLKYYVDYVRVYQK